MKLYWIEEVSVDLAERYFWSNRDGRWKTLPEAEFYTHIDTATKIAKEFMSRRPEKSLKIICYLLTEVPI